MLGRARDGVVRARGRPAAPTAPACRLQRPFRGRQPGAMPLTPTTSWSCSGGARGITADLGRRAGAHDQGALRPAGAFLARGRPAGVPRRRRRQIAEARPARCGDREWSPDRPGGARRAGSTDPGESRDPRDRRPHRRGRRNGPVLRGGRDGLVLSPRCARRSARHDGADHCPDPRSRRARRPTHRRQDRRPVRRGVHTKVAGLRALLDATRATG